MVTLSPCLNQRLNPQTHCRKTNVPSFGCTTLRKIQSFFLLLSHSDHNKYFIPNLMDLAWRYLTQPYCDVRVWFVLKIYSNSKQKLDLFSQLPIPQAIFYKHFLKEKKNQTHITQRTRDTAVSGSDLKRQQLLLGQVQVRRGLMKSDHLFQGILPGDGKNGRGCL